MLTNTVAMQVKRRESLTRFPGIPHSFSHLFDGTQSSPSHYLGAFVTPKNEVSKPEILSQRTLRNIDVACGNYDAFGSSPPDANSRLTVFYPVGSPRSRQKA